MKKTAIDCPEDELLPEYDFSKGETGKFYGRYGKTLSVALLEPDVHAMFPNSEAVNRALRAVGELVKAAKPRRKK
ncbi:MAG: hypothetical protein FJY67_12065, partial [Calditrichaeota bacterium]|nr:hypothetical protein [Calditrichota bacterium]